MLWRKVLPVAVALALSVPAGAWLLSPTVDAPLASSAAPPAAPALGVEPGETMAPLFELHDVLGKGAIRIEDLRGKAIVIDFFATWCKPCKPVMTALVEMRKEYAAERLEILSVDADPSETEEQVRAYMEEHGATWWGGLGAEAAEAYGVRSIPAVFVVDPMGRITYAKTGAPVVGDDMFRSLRRAVDEALAVEREELVGHLALLLPAGAAPVVFPVARAHDVALLLADGPAGGFAAAAAAIRVKDAAGNVVLEWRESARAQLPANIATGATGPLTLAFGPGLAPGEHRLEMEGISAPFQLSVVGVSYGSQVSAGQASEDRPAIRP
ncbi:MAG TPA: TlpA disulfide reductase family protein [Candidatus Thermoplasmatota archaeon]|nr:TlpA disulfide reductase family protein [Candidatus Thermoplasmatota archaeon]